MVLEHTRNTIQLCTNFTPEQFGKKLLLSLSLNAEEVCLCTWSYLSCCHLSRQMTDCEIFRHLPSAEWSVPLRCYTVPVHLELYLSLFRCACPCWAALVFVTLCLSLSGCASLWYAANKVPLCWPLCVPLLFR